MSPEPRSQRFTREHRLRTRGEFQAAQQRGRRWAGHNFVLFSYRAGNQPARVGITVSRKVGNAVIRNRVKRTVREFFRRSRYRGAGLRAVVIARVGAGTRGSEAIVAELDTLFGRACGATERA